MDRACLRVAQHGKPFMGRPLATGSCCIALSLPRKRGRHDNADRCEISPKAGDFVRFRQQAGRSEDDCRSLEIHSFKAMDKI